jgi:hypothetical protein
MTIEKLQKVATAAVEPHYKARWLRWWNSGTGGRKAYRFPDLGFTELIFDSWLAKATFWAQVIRLSNLYFGLLQVFFQSSLNIFHVFQLEEGFLQEFQDFESVEFRNIATDLSLEVLSPSSYIEKWRIVLWDKGFLPFFNKRGDPQFTKSTKFKDYPGTDKAVKRVLYRYFLLLLLVLHPSNIFIQFKVISSNYLNL